MHTMIMKDVIMGKNNDGIATNRTANKHLEQKVVLRENFILLRALIIAFTFYKSQSRILMIAFFFQTNLSLVVVIPQSYQYLFEYYNM